MADNSTIEWTDATWNPIAGCSLKSPGCTNCYAMPTAHRHEMMSTALGRVSPYAGLTHKVNGKAVWNGEMRLVEAALPLPLRWTRPRRIFVNSMSDLFHENVPDAWIDRVFVVMALCPQHTFQVLTKRADRMRAYLAQFEQRGRYVVSNTRQQIGPDPRDGNRFLLLDEGQRWPLPNVWLGVSAEDQRRADERVPDLLMTPAAVRFVSAEPLLGPIDFRNLELSGDYVLDALSPASAKDIWDDCWSPEATGMPLAECIRDFEEEGHSYPPSETKRPGLNWVIVGGESGPGARPMHPDWARQIRDACAAAGVAFHFKQAGSWVALKADGGQWPEDTPIAIRFRPDGSRGPDGWPMQLVGKKAAGRLLDGAEHNGMPKVA